MLLFYSQKMLSKAKRLIKNLLPAFIYFLIINRNKVIFRRSRLLNYINYLNVHHPSLPITVLDLGARLGLVDEGFEELKLLKNCQIIGVEADKDECDRILSDKSLGNYTRCDDLVLWTKTEAATIYITKLKGCSSILEPNVEFLKDFQCGNWFEIKEEVPVVTTSFEDFCSSLPNLDFIKIDLQGIECDLLSAYPKITTSATGICLEVQFEELYKNQKTFEDIHPLLRGQGFSLIKLHEESDFYDGYCLEANCSYLRNPSKNQLSKSILLKTILFCLVSSNIKAARAILQKALDHDEVRETSKEISNVIGVDLEFKYYELLGPHN